MRTPLEDPRTGCAYRAVIFTWDSVNAIVHHPPALNAPTHRNLYSLSSLLALLSFPASISLHHRNPHTLLLHPTPMQARAPARPFHPSLTLPSVALHPASEALLHGASGPPSTPSERNWQCASQSRPSERAHYLPIASPLANKRTELASVRAQIAYLQARASVLEAELASGAPTFPAPFGMVAAPHDSALRALLAAPVAAYVGPAPTPSEQGLWRASGVTGLLRLF